MCSHCSRNGSIFAVTLCHAVALYIVNVTGGPDMTVRHFIHENYDSLNMTCFVKDRDQLGSRVQVSSALEKDSTRSSCPRDRGGFVHIAQDPVRVGGSSLTTFLLFGVTVIFIVQAASTIAVG